MQTLLVKRAPEIKWSKEYEQKVNDNWPIIIKDEREVSTKQN